MDSQRRGWQMTIFLQLVGAVAPPICTVKRYRRSKSPASSVSQPPVVLFATAKISPVVPRNRWDGVHLAQQYKPPSMGSLPCGGLPPPSPRPRLFAERSLPLGGLQYESFADLKVHHGPIMHQLAPELGPHKAVRPPLVPVQPQALVVSAPLSVSMDVVGPSHSSSSTMLEVHQQLKQQHVQAWLQLLQEAGAHSDLVRTTATSETPELHRARVIARYAPSTLAAYLRSWHSWVEFCGCHQACPYQPSTTLVADFLQVSSRKSSLGVATAQSRSLTWVSKHAGFSVLRQALDTSLVKSYIIPPLLALRKEAAPLPLSFVVYLEQANSS